MAFQGNADAEVAAQVSTPMTKDESLAPKSLPGWKACTIIFSCTLFMIINISTGPAFALALPSVGADLNIPETSLQWVISSYTLTSGCFLLLFGRLADLHGRRRTFLAGATWVVIWSIGCGFANKEISLDVMRAFQGMGVAAGVPAALGLLAQTFEVGSTLRTLAFATFSCGAPLGGAVGFTIGSVLTQETSAKWRSPLFFTAGLAGLTFVTGWLSIDEDTHHLDPALDRRVDWIGAFLVTSGLVFLTYSLGDGETAPHGWRTSYIIALLVLSVILLCAFVLWEYHLGNHPSSEEETSSQSGRGFINNLLTAPPLLKLDLFARANGRMAAMQALAFFVWAGFSGWIFYAALYYQTYLGLTPILTMVRMLPMTVTGIILNGIVALAIAHVQGIVLLVIGCIMTGLAPLLFAVIDTSATYWAYGFPAATAAVFGADFIFASGSLFVAKVARPNEQSVAGGLFNTLAQVGTSVGLAISSVVLDRTISRKIRSLDLPQLPSSSASISDTPKAALLAGYRAVQWLNFAFVMVGLVLALTFLKRIGVIARMKGGGNSDEERVESGVSGAEGVKG